jgi:hypothetical protein
MRSEELRFLEQVKEIFPGFPPGQFVKTEAPDFVLTSSDDLTIGIEITKIFKDLESGQSELKKKASFKNLINEGVLAIIKKNHEKGIAFDIDLKDEFAFRSNQRDQLIRELADIVLEEFTALKKNYDHLSLEHIDLDLSSPEYAAVKSIILARGYRNFPPGVKDMSLSRFDGITTFYMESGGGVVPDLTMESLTLALEPKEKKLPTYKTCDLQWLIIVEGHDFTGYFSDINIPIPIASAFDRVILYRQFKQECIQLK